MPTLTSIKDFVAGAVLTAQQMDDVNCGVKVFASNTTRDAAYGGSGERTLEVGETCYITGTGELQVYDGTTWTNASPLDGRNVIINGALQVAQRGTSTASITSGGYYTADRWRFAPSSMGTWTNSIENDAPTGSGFRKSWKVLVTTADAAPAAGDFVLAQQRLEGQNLQQFLKGTSSAKSYALSFWVKSNVTGTYIAELGDADNTRSVSASYTVSASATWEKKTIVFPADTTGAFDNDNAESLSLTFWLGAGTTYTSGTLATTWAATSNANRAVGQTNLASAINNYWQVTGVQLEPGSVTSAFEFEDYGTTLAKCQRYYQEFGGDAATETFSYGFATSATVVESSITAPVTMRTVPTATFSSASDFGSSDGTSGTTGSTIATNTALSSKIYFHLRYTTGGAVTQYRPYRIEAASTTNARARFSAEL